MLFKSKILQFGNLLTLTNFDFFFTQSKKNFIFAEKYWKDE